MSSFSSSAVLLEVTDRKGQARQVHGQSGVTLMHALKEAGLPVAATCSGAMSCATCHVYIDEGLDRVGHPSEDEVDLLSESSHFQEGRSRLSCQIFLDADVEGLRLSLAPQD